MIEQILDSGQRCPNARIIGDTPFRIQRNVEINAYQRALPRDVDITDRLFIHNALSRRIRSPVAR